MKRIWRTIALILLLAFIGLYSDFNPCQSWEFPFTYSNESFWDRIGVTFQFGPNVCENLYSLAFPEDQTAIAIQVDMNKVHELEISSGFVK